MSNYQVCFIGNAIVDIISKFSDKNLKELKIPKGSMQLIDEKSSNLILDYIKNKNEDEYSKIIETLGLRR